MVGPFDITASLFRLGANENDVDVDAVKPASFTSAIATYYSYCYYCYYHYFLGGDGGAGDGDGGGDYNEYDPMLTGGLARIMTSTEDIVIDDAMNMDDNTTLAEQDQGQIDNLSPIEIHVILFVPRIFGSIGLLCSLCMLVLAWKRRTLVFHRIVLGLSLHLFIIATCLIYGPAAIPKVSNHTAGNHGTITTCTAQGMLLYTSFLSAALYYGSLSLYSFLGVLSNFHITGRHLSIERWIHIGVHVYPLITVLYLMSEKGFNNVGTGYCLTGSDDPGCMNPQNKDEPCDRGPSAEEWAALNFFWIVPLTILLVVPSAVMAVLYVKVRNQQDRVFIASKDVAKQSVIYLLSLQWVTWPFLIQQIFAALAATGHSTEANAMFALAIISMTISVMFELWVLLIYVYFSFDVSIAGMVATRRMNLNFSDANSSPATSKQELSAGGTEQKTTNRASGSHAHAHAHTHTHTQRMNYIFRSQEIKREDVPAVTSVEEGESPVPITPADRSSSFSFNIFDGTNASGAFAEFVFDDDSDDERADTTKRTLKERSELHVVVGAAAEENQQQ